MSVKRRFRQRGDTIVEVMISILVVSMVLTGAYVTTNRSTLGIRDAQEHAEALKLVQGQLEQVRNSAGTATQAVYSQTSGSAFCMVAGQVVSATVMPGAAKCVQDASGNQTDPTIQPAYKLTIKRTDCTVATNCNQFTIQAVWDSVSAKTTATEQITYRLHK